MDIRVPKSFNHGLRVHKMRTHGPFLSIKCLNKGPWKEGPGPEKIMQWHFSMKKSEITA